MTANGRDVHRWLALAGLDHLCDEMRERPVPLLKVFELFRLLARQEGPSVCARVISPESLGDLGVFGSVILGSRTPRDALTHVLPALPRYSTHEIVTLRPIPGGLRFQAGWSLVLDDETMNLTQQYTAALIVGLCLATRHPDAVPQTISIWPHPVSRLEHLRPIFGKALIESNEPILKIDLDDRILDAPLQFGARHSFEQPAPDWTMPKGESSFSSSVSLALQSLSAEMRVSINQIAGLAGMSVRSFQRALAAEGANFRSIQDELRRVQAISTLTTDPRSGHLVAAELGYSAQSSMSRAVRRWTGVSPRAIKSNV